MRLAALLFAVSMITMLAGAQTTFSNIEAMSGWHACSDCAGAGGNATYSMVQGISSPSLNGNSTKFSLGGTTPWSHALFYKTVSGNSTATHFIYDLYYYYTTPQASSGMEFAFNQRKGYQWYKWDLQCSYLSGIWRVYDDKNKKWIDTSISCNRPSAYSWTHLILEGTRSSGKVVYVAVTVNGTKHYFNRSVYPQQMSSTASQVGIRYQINGDGSQTDYSTWGNKFKLTYW
jgi:hypothetical protein